MTDFPSFGGVTHPAFRIDWLLMSLDRLFTATDKIDLVGFDFSAHEVNNDNAHLVLDGTAFFRARNAEGDPFEHIDEELLDEIPAVRCLERRASALWHNVPILLTCEASIDGEVSFYAERGLIRYEFRNWDETWEIGFEARHNGSDWVASETVTVFDYHGSLIDLAGADVESVTLQAFNATADGFKGQPKALKVGIGANDEVILHLEPGELSRLMPDHS